jgi:hypothetical protein
LNENMFNAHPITYPGITSTVGKRIVAYSVPNISCQVKLMLIFSSPKLKLHWAIGLLM